MIFVYSGSKSNVVSTSPTIDLKIFNIALIVESCFTKAWYLHFLSKYVSFSHLGFTHSSSVPLLIGNKKDRKGTGGSGDKSQRHAVPRDLILELLGCP